MTQAQFLQLKESITALNDFIQHAYTYEEDASNPSELIYKADKGLHNIVRFIDNIPPTKR